MTVVRRTSGDRKILLAPGTNQIAGFSGYRPLTIKEINKQTLPYLTLMYCRSCTEQEQFVLI